MNEQQMHQIFLDTDFVHSSGTPEELRVAEYLKLQCEALGVPARLEPFPVVMAEIETATVEADGRQIPCKGVFCCGSGSVEGELYYMPDLDPVSLAGARDKIVLLDSGGVRFFPYHDLMEAGAKGLLFQYGNPYYPNRDIDERELRAAVVGDERKVLCAMLHTADAIELVRSRAKQIRITIQQREYEGQSHNVVAELPGRSGKYLTLTAHYDTTALSHGSYDNMSGCVGLLGILDALREQDLNFGLRLVFCGSEERGLLGSTAYVNAHELSDTVLNINLDMIGSVMGKFIACVSAEEKLTNYISYLAAELGFPVAARTGVYSSDSTAFADKGVPALSFARIAANGVAPIHCRYDLPELLSMDQLESDIAFLVAFTRRMAVAAVCPVAREIPDSIKTELDEFLSRKRKM